MDGRVPADWWEGPGQRREEATPHRPGIGRGSVGLKATVRSLLAGGLLLAPAVGAHAQPAQPTPLRNLVDDQVVAKIGYCRGEYMLTMANGAEHRYREFDLRFKTDGSSSGPESGKPALLSAGMRGDRAQVIFASLDDLKRFLVERCGG